MKIKRIGMMILAGWVGSASANVILIDYQFNDAAGTGLSSVHNDGTSTAAWADVAGYETDGNGVLHVTGTNKSKEKLPIVSPAIASGTVACSWTIASFDLTGSSAGATYFMADRTAAGDNVQMGLLYDGTEVFIQQNVAGNYATNVSLGGITSATTALTLRTVTDIDAGTVTADWQWAGGAWNTVWQDKAIAEVGPMDQMRFGFSTGPNPGYIDVDSYTISASIPEPSTLGLFVIAAGGILFSRRKKQPSGSIKI